MHRDERDDDERRDGERDAPVEPERRRDARDRGAAGEPDRPEDQLLPAEVARVPEDARPLDVADAREDHDPHAHQRDHAEEEDGAGELHRPAPAAGTRMRVPGSRSSSDLPPFSERSLSGWTSNFIAME